MTLSPSYNRRALLVGALASGGAACVAVSRAEGQAAPQAADPLAGRFGGPFTLTAHDGRRLSDQDFRGRFMLIFFGFTRCPDICPTDLATMAKALELLGPLADTLARGEGLQAHARSAQMRLRG